MVGREVTELFPRVPHTPGEPVLELSDWRGRRGQSVDLTVRRGEILGIAGLVGAGRTELLRASSGSTRYHPAPSFSKGSAASTKSPRRRSRRDLGS